MTIPRRTNSGRQPRRVLLLVLGVSAVVAVVLLLVSLRSPPQLGTDEEVFRSVDALFTAVTARDERLLSQCEQRLHAFRAAGRIPTEAAAYLDDVIAQARGGRWRSAAQRLYDFMKAQRREKPEHDRP